jgi:DNA-binding MarR family transcriptional regulator
MSTKTTTIPHTFYLSLLEFLMNSKHHIMQLGNQHGITPMQAMTLMLTKPDEPRPMNSFCKLFNCDASNVTGIVDGLEEKGLVSRQANPDDRRVKQIRLQPAGRKLQAKLVEELSADDSFVLAPLTREETEQFVRIIEKLSTAYTDK